MAINIPRDEFTESVARMAAAFWDWQNNEENLKDNRYCTLQVTIGCDGGLSEIQYYDPVGEHRTAHSFEDAMKMFKLEGRAKGKLIMKLIEEEKEPKKKNNKKGKKKMQDEDPKPQEEKPVEAPKEETPAVEKPKEEKPAEDKKQ